MNIIQMTPLWTTINCQKRHPRTLPHQLRARDTQRCATEKTEPKEAKQAPEAADRADSYLPNPCRSPGKTGSSVSAR